MFQQHLQGADHNKLESSAATGQCKLTTVTWGHRFLKPEVNQWRHDFGVEHSEIEICFFEAHDGMSDMFVHIFRLGTFRFWGTLLSCRFKFIKQLAVSGSQTKTFRQLLLSSTHRNQGPLFGAPWCPMQKVTLTVHITSRFFWIWGNHWHSKLLFLVLELVNKISLQNRFHGEWTP